MISQLCMRESLTFERGAFITEDYTRLCLLAAFCFYTLGVIKHDKKTILGSYLVIAPWGTYEIRF